MKFFEVFGGVWMDFPKRQVCMLQLRKEGGTGWIQSKLQLFRFVWIEQKIFCCPWILFFIFCAFLSECDVSLVRFLLFFHFPNILRPVEKIRLSACRKFTSGRRFFVLLFVCQNINLEFCSVRSEKICWKIDKSGLLNVLFGSRRWKFLKMRREIRIFTEYFKNFGRFLPFALLSLE